MKVYYAHCMTLYGTPQEERDLDLLYSLNFNVVSPSSEVFKIALNEALAKVPFDESDFIMWFCTQRVKECDLLAFRALPDGSLPAGVAAEIKTARDHGMVVIELPNFSQRRTLTVDETREYLREAGQR